MIRRAGVISTVLAAGVLSLAAAMPASATPPKLDDPPVSGDDRAKAYPGNAKTCADAMLAGEIVLKGDEGPEKMSIDPAKIPAGYDLTGVVIKGADAYNVYVPAVLTDLVAPLKNGKHPEISHWYVCGTKKTTSSTPSTPPSSPPSNPSNPGTPSSSSPASSAPAVGGNAVVSGDDDELAATGFSSTGPLVGGGALVLLGAGLLMALRRTRRQRG
jgi:hypothetical protein